MKTPLLVASLLFNTIAFSSEIAPLAGIGFTLDTAQARALGIGCPAGSVSFVGDGDEFRALTTGLGIDLAGDAGALAGLSNCTFVVPARLPLGVFPLSLDRSLTGLVEKSLDSSVRLSSQLVMFGQSLAPVEFAREQGHVGVASEAFEVTLTQNFGLDEAWKQAWCNPQRSEEGNITVRVRISGVRESSQDLLRAQLASQVKLFDHITFADCPDAGQSAEAN